MTEPVGGVSAIEADELAVHVERRRERAARHEAMGLFLELALGVTCHAFSACKGPTVEA